jgi:hypothetical protein
MQIVPDSNKVIGTMRQTPEAFMRRLQVSVIAAVLCVLISNMALAVPAVNGKALRCGWFDNPTPQNAYLTDRHGTWTLSEQGRPEHTAKGDAWPEFKRSQWVRTNAGSYGYGCACLSMTVDAESGLAREVFTAVAKPLAVCRKDKALKRLEPENPLKQK